MTGSLPPGRGVRVASSVAATMPTTAAPTNQVGWGMTMML